MRRLTFVRDGDRGAVAMIVAMLFGFGVMLALAALTVDVGNINADRRQLQNGADAVAMAAAKQCAETGACPSAASPGLQALANANSATGTNRASEIRRVDGQTPAICGNGGGLPACPSSSVPSLQQLQECPRAPAAGVNFVRVYTETKNADTGQNLLPYSFGSAIAGAGSGANQQTCASVSWGQPSGAAAPIAISYCEWAKATGNNPVAPVPGAGTYAQNPVGGWPGYVAGFSLADPPVPTWPAPAAPLPAAPIAGAETIIGLQGSSVPGCSTWNGHDGPGGFGYLNTATTCDADAPVNGWIQVDTGNTMPSGCELLPYFNKIIYLPVYECMVTSVGGAPTFTPGPGTACLTGNGSNTWYYVTGYAKFYLSGYKTGGGASATKARTQLVTPQEPCSGSDRCISGWFLRGLVNAPPAPTSTSGSPPLGAYTLQFAG